MKDFRTLQVWQKAHAFVQDLYEVTQTFPAQESYGITSQIRRAAVSIPSNIAEGCAAMVTPSFAAFFSSPWGLPPKPNTNSFSAKFSPSSPSKNITY